MKNFIVRVVARHWSRRSGHWETHDLLDVRIEVTSKRKARDIVRGVYKQPQFAIGKTWKV